MSKIITIKLTKINPLTGPFVITDEFSDIIDIDVPREALIEGMSFDVSDETMYITIESTGKCKIKKTFPLSEFNLMEYAEASYTPAISSSLWAHLKNGTIYNTYYGNIHPYIIEYPFAYQLQDEILKSIVDYTKVYSYTQDGIRNFNNVNKIQVDDVWFNKAILYNDQQSTGVLELVSKPINNLSVYFSFPKYNENSKTILFTKSDNLYNYNTFWSIVKDKTSPLFIKTCENMSIDKYVNQENMDYSSRSFLKEPLRAKNLKIRHILDNKNNINIVSQFIIADTQKSIK